MEHFFLWLKKFFTIDRSAIFVVLVVIFYFLIHMSAELNDWYTKCAARLPVPTTFCFSIGEQLQFFNHSWVVLLTLPLYVGVVFFCEKVIKKLVWLK